MTKAQALFAEFERELETTRRFLDRVPADRLAWKPHEKSMTAGQLALHIAQIPMMVLGMSMEDESSPPDMSKPREQPASPRAISEALDRSAEYVRRTLPGIDDQRMSRVINIMLGGKPVFAAPREAFLRTVMFNHWYHHRGQLGVYLRLLGAVVPSSYGPSGDESPF